MPGNSIEFDKTQLLERDFWCGKTNEAKQQMKQEPKGPSTERVTRSQVLRIQARSNVVFPLFCPVREAEYLRDWEAEILYSKSGVAEEGCIFRTPNPGGEPSIWTIRVHDEATGLIEFVIVTPESRVSTLVVELRDADHGTTDVRFTYTHTAIADPGRAFIAEFTEERFLEKMTGFENSLNEFLAAADHA